MIIHQPYAAIFTYSAKNVTSNKYAPEFRQILIVVNKERVVQNLIIDFTVVGQRSDEILGQNVQVDHTICKSLPTEP